MMECANTWLLSAGAVITFAWNSVTECAMTRMFPAGGAAVAFAWNSTMDCARTRMFLAGAAVAFAWNSMMGVIGRGCSLLELLLLSPETL
jgi:hypothetical protein